MSNYSGLKEIDTMPYKMVEKLIDSADEDLWRLLKYDDPEALSKPKLNRLEKVNLIWMGQRQQQDKCRIFFTRTIEDNIPSEHCIIKIFNWKMNPINAYTVNVVWVWEFLWGANQSIVYNRDGIPVNRGDLMMRHVMQCLNGEYVGGIGEISFISDRNRWAQGQSIIGNTTNYTGYTLTLPTLVGKKEVCCE